MSVVFVVTMVLSVFEMCLYKDRMITYETDSEYARDCENIASIFITEYADNLNSGVGEPINDAVYTVLGSYPGGHEIFNILASEEKVHFYKSNEETVNYSDYSLQEMLDEMIKAGGDNVDELVALINEGKSGSVRMTVDSSEDYYLVYYHNFKIDGKEFGIMHFVLESYYLTNSKVDRHFTYMLVIVGIIGVNLIIAICAVAYVVKRYNKMFTIKDAEIVKCQASINELNDKIKNKKNDSKHGNVKDEVLGVYSSYFMNSLVIDAQKRGVFASVAVIGASYRSRYNRQVWNGFMAYLKKNLSENYILGMIDDKHLILIGISADDEKFQDDVVSILKGAAEEFKEDEFSPVYVFGSKKDDGDTLNKVIKDAIYSFDNNAI